MGVAAANAVAEISSSASEIMPTTIARLGVAVEIRRNAVDRRRARRGRRPALGTGSVDLGLDSGLDAGVDLGGADVDLDRGRGPDTPIDAGLHLGKVDASVDAGVDLARARWTWASTWVSISAEASTSVSTSN